jgi:hypothetical protein
VLSSCAGHLDAAILCLSLRPDDPDPGDGVARTCAYVLARLTFLNQRLRLLY